MDAFSLLILSINVCNCHDFIRFVPQRTKVRILHNMEKNWKYCEFFKQFERLFVVTVTQKCTMCVCFNDRSFKMFTSSSQIISRLALWPCWSLITRKIKGSHSKKVNNVCRKCDHWLDEISYEKCCNILRRVSIGSWIAAYCLFRHFM